MRVWGMFLPVAAIPCAAAIADGPTGMAPTTDTITRGERVYRESCASCHDNPQGRTPSRRFLVQTRSPDYILRALTMGVMRDITAGVSLDDKKAVATYLLGRPPRTTPEASLDANLCASAGPPITLTGSMWNGWSGSGHSNARFQPNPGFTRADVPRLKLKWAFSYQGSAFSEPTVVNGRVFVSSVTGTVYSLDARTGCTYWTRDLGAPTRGQMSVGRMPSGRFAIYATNWKGKVSALDAMTGKEIWSAIADGHHAARLTGAPILYQGRLYVPVSSGEETLSNDPKYVCCTFRGSLVAYDAATGRRLWKSYTIDKAPAPIPGDPHRMGPSGSPLWMSPTIDARRGLIYVASGNNYSDPTTDSSNAVMAFDLATGRKRWTSQVFAENPYVTGCEAPNRHVNCPTGEVGPDRDFGSSPILVKTSSGKDMIVATNKGGIVFGMDPDRRGQIIWQTRIGQGGIIGGIQWGAATDGLRVYAPVSDYAYDGPLPGSDGYKGKAGLNALDPVTGKLLWHVSAPIVKCSWEGLCSGAHFAAAIAMPGVVFSSAWDGHIRAYAAESGAILWDFDTGGDWPAVNGGKATGGSIDHGGQTLADGLLFVNSGGRQGQPGNALMVFSVDGK